MNMSRFTIDDSACNVLSGKVIIITGGSSGIGFATAQHLASLGAKIVQGDLQPPAEPVDPSIVYKRTNVTQWTDLRALFNEAKARHGCIDHVYANAGMLYRRPFSPTIANAMIKVCKVSERMSTETTSKRMKS